MSVSEQLALARTSIDLGDVMDELGAVDWLRAAGSVGREHATAIAVWQLVDQQDRAAFEPALRGLLALCARLGVRHNAVATVTHVLDWMARPVCPTCRGRAFRLHPGTDRLSDQRCPDCNGTGQRPQADWAEDEHRLYAQLQTEQGAAATAISRRLGAA